MKRVSEVPAWNDLSKKAYWDRDVPLDVWRKSIREGHPSYLPHAVAAFDPVEFIHYYGVATFKHDWPKLRTFLESSVMRRHGPVFDLAWSRLVGKCWNLPPDARILEMPPRKQAFLMAVARHPGASIYEIASDLGMQYRRAHDHAKDLAESGLVEMQPSVRRGRMRMQLFPALPRTASASSAATTAPQNGN